MDTLQANTTTIAKVLCIRSNKAWKWYRDFLSGFTDDAVQKEMHKNDIEVKEKGAIRTIGVPILETENFGENMAIDEKKIGEDMHTVISNRDTGKIAVLARTLKASDLELIIPKFNSKGFEVRTITRDLSNTYDWFSRSAFMNARHIADKFHIIKNLLDAGQDVRIRYRQEALRKRRIKHDTFKKKEKEREKRCKKDGEKFIKKKFSYKAKKFDNQETELELLARSRYLLYKYESDWTDTQKERAEILFKEYPQIKKAYELSLKFRTWYRKDNIGSDISLINKILEQWYEQVEKADIDEISNFRSLVERHQPHITAYFKEGHTNAIAECINSKIQRFITINQGTRDREFFYFRMKNYFSAPQKEI